MSINFITSHSAERMNSNDLVVGQHLTRLHLPDMRWGDVTGSFRTEEYTVVKVLKTQLVLENCSTGSELRLRLENHKWSLRNGEVTTDRIGDSSSWNRTTYRFATEDEPVIEKLKSYYEDLLQQANDERAAKAAIAEIKNNLKAASLEQVEATIQALQVVADNLRAKS